MNKKIKKCSNPFSHFFVAPPLNKKKVKDEDVCICVWCGLIKTINEIYQWRIEYMKQ